MTTDRRLSIVTVTAHRPHAPEYHAYSTMLMRRAVAVSQAAGWTVDVVAAEDVPVGETLARTDAADAVVLLGGEDIAPEYYGAARGYRAEGRHAERADEAQILLARRAVDRGTPLLGICRGHQIINVALGGTLLQDLGEGSAHRRDGEPIERVMSTHDVQLTAGTAIAGSLIGRLGRVVSTQSAHHQAVARLGSGLEVVAVADDGLVEAIAHRDAPVLGVQWHPEDPGAVDGQFGALLAVVTEPARAVAVAA
ncbi:gamma-glutamyl-gamma-aminobutyrate hydrolase family protein [Herbiconiux sp. CPCC 205716]|uniref:Gamma-glutamyl-gamma-aminobutyrate hydrolase family protein n=1 Tax=Herbiconiux gentiana TaxID=2970912 RepID=A0ABT2GFQ7_9MICO|nr:gamma-glutamyl-gamma-aminobutyrate hydrolase family protein [Herbiconiux gentiana]MCS5715068.1 gamma-glutamyl-gamma-aminobutyrate hydrolase family protein [Herbiconiux gentiana]